MTSLPTRRHAFSSCMYFQQETTKYMYGSFYAHGSFETFKAFETKFQKSYFPGRDSYLVLFTHDCCTACGTIPQMQCILLLCIVMSAMTMTILNSCISLTCLRFLRMTFPLLSNQVHTGHNLVHVFCAVHLGPRKNAGVSMIYDLPGLV